MDKVDKSLLGADFVASREQLREATADMLFTSIVTPRFFRLRRYLRRRGDWLVWLMRPDAELPRRWWM